jgi:dipeptidyl aminopeptidase/acylaminoacyl peptidase
MGNDQSTVIEEERKMLESLYQIAEGRLDTNDVATVNSKLNRGTAAPNCQPSHTIRELEEEARRKEEEELAELMNVDDSRHESYLAERRNSKGSGNNGNTAEPQPEKGSIGSYVQMAKTGYQELVNAIIRPPRAQYREEHLGPPAFSFLGKRFTRTDFTLQTQRGLSLQCSHWEPVERTADRIPIVIYMHGNASARVEVLPQLTCLLALGVAVFAFDFAGSGKSDGEHVSLGFYEREDLMCVVAHLRATDVVSTIALWGRSMGAGEFLCQCSNA